MVLEGVPTPKVFPRVTMRIPATIKGSGRCTRGLWLQLRGLRKTEASCMEVLVLSNAGASSSA